MVVMSSGRKPEISAIDLSLSQSLDMIEAVQDCVRIQITDISVVFGKADLLRF
jgi:hypothetical protein